ncbi:MAG: DUF1156 domain-containing protein [Chloroflexi bacterium]|nr:DUF1156 domain-containing protein [Chloroflexota bacterium]
MIDMDSFPFEFVSALAERESWRKEVYRPIYHIHKWWAQRLGSVFRAILLGCVLPADADLKHQFYQAHCFRGISVFDPFMGSGTTIGEAHKLGFTALGRDINPVACESVRVAFGHLDRRSIINGFSYLAENVGSRIRELYRSTDENGIACDVLYYFWVKTLPCRHCGGRVDLFSSRVVARNACPDKKPQVQISCPGCHEIFAGSNTDAKVSCPVCDMEFNPHVGSANGVEAICQSCHKSFRIAEAVRLAGQPPSHRLYAKLLLTPDGRKKYLAATPSDIESYNHCSGLLKNEIASRAVRLPEGMLSDGHNTRQAMGYNYRAWRDFFNDRQLLALGWLQRAISTLPEQSSREAFWTLFSGVLEFNNLFASYKGEGTGAVRHMFAHHILKPERTPIEANLWGTFKSSGSFSNLFKSRLLRILDYRDSPFEVCNNGGTRAFPPGTRFSGQVRSWPREYPFEPRAIYLSCGSSDETRLPDRAVDLVVTDPPFFDNVHYSELADFFYAWQTLYPRGFITFGASTRNQKEVQDTDKVQFSRKLGSVFAECRRILRNNGYLVFTYHHSRPEGWTSLVAAIVGSEFSVVNAHPVKSEMSVATPKSQAKEPIQMDVILVCRKREFDQREPVPVSQALALAIAKSTEKARRLTSIGLRLSLNDKRVIVVSQFIAALGPLESVDQAMKDLVDSQHQLEVAALGLCCKSDHATGLGDPSLTKQMPLPLACG